ncbi:MAG: NTP transferase domain-containing protein [Nitrososphaerota archaeon]|nr:NTP transferase domain-containing protein [Nitrososphaerota archaeon]
MILAGGLGTRLRPLTLKIPKPMIDINGRPFLEIKLIEMIGRGIKDYVFCVGYLGKVIENYFGDGGKFGARLRYSYDGEELLGPIGALKKAEEMLNEGFLVTYADNYATMDYFGLMERLKSSKALGVMAVLHNRNRWGKSDVDVRDGFVTKYSKGSSNKFEWINYGVTALKREALGLVESGRTCNEEEFYNLLIKMKQLLAYEVGGRFYEIGTPEGLKEFEKLVSEGLVAA